MLCEKCQSKPATVHVTKIHNNKKTELNLCEKCAHESGELSVSFEPNLTLHNFLANFLSQDYMEAFTKQRLKEQQCPKCGFTLKHFSQLGRLGCSECYETFGTHLETMLRRIHGTSQHNGKLPRRIGGSIRLKQEINQLRNQLQQAINREEFEKAAELRDQIKGLERDHVEEV